MEPYRFQVRRVKGWKMPENGVYVGRPTKWGNPFPITKSCPRHTSIQKFEEYLRKMDPTKREELLSPLRGKPLGCWCKLSDKCHADVLLHWANR
jgi:hypothetical protein